MADIKPLDPSMFEDAASTASGGQAPIEQTVQPQAAPQQPVASEPIQVAANGAVPSGTQIPQAAQQLFAKQQAAQPAHQPQQAKATAGPQPLDPSMFDDSHPSDFGLYQWAPITKSPLSPDERLKLAMGNTAGREAYLKQRFQDVSKDEKGNYLVKDNGLWHMVDGKAFGDADAWEATRGILKAAPAIALGALAGINPTGALMDQQLKKSIGQYGYKTTMESATSLASSDPVAKELVGKAADIAPEVAAYGISTAMGAVSGGASIVAQAAAAGAGAMAFKGAQTSLGRIVGTYDATPEEQVRDLALEGILNFGGVMVVAGVKPTASWLADKIPGLATAYNKMDKASKWIIRNTYGRLSAGEEAFDVMQQMPSELSGKMRAFGSAESFEQAAQADSIRHMSNISKATPGLTSELYGKLQGQLLEATDANFKSRTGATVVDVFKNAVESGMGTLERNGERLSIADAGSLLAQHAETGLPKDVRFVMHEPGEILGREIATGMPSDLSSIATNKAAYRKMNAFFQDLNRYSMLPEMEGKAGAQQMLALNQRLHSATWDLRAAGQSSESSALTRFAAESHKAMDARLSAAFDSQVKNADGQGLFTLLNKTFSDVKSATQRIADAAAPGKDARGAESLLRRVISGNPTSNVTEKESLKYLQSVADQYGLSQAGLIREAQKNIRLNEAAKAFNLPTNPKIAVPLVSGAGLATVTHTLSNPVGLATGGAVLGATSPKLAYGMFKLKDLIAGVGTKGVQQLTERPELLFPAVNAVMSLPQQQAQMTNSLVQKATGGGQ